MTWLKTFLNEPGSKEGSSHRLMLVLLITTILVLVAFITITTRKFPEVPTSLQELVQYLGSILIGGIAFGKGAKVYREVKSTAATTATGLAEPQP